MPDSRNPAARLIGGAFWSGAGTAAFQLLALVASVLVARRLSPEDFGAFGLLQSSVATFGLLGTAGMGLTVARYAAEFRRSDPARASRVLGLANLSTYLVSIAIGGFILIQAPWIARTVLNEPGLADELRIASLAMVLMAIAAVQAGALAGLEAFRAIAWLNVIRGALTLVALPAGASLGGVRGVLIALGAVAVIMFLAGERVTLLQRRRFGVQRNFAMGWQEWRVLAAFALPAYVTGFIYPAVLWGLGTLIVQQPAGYIAMALFSAAAQWRLAVAFLPQLLSQPAMSVLANVAGRGDGDGYRRVLRLSLWLTTLSALVPGLLVIVLAGPILSVFGATYVAAAPALAWLALSVVLNAPCLIVGSALASRGYMWWVAALNGLWAAAVFVMFFLLRMDDLAQRAGAAVALAHVVHLAASLALLRLAVADLPAVAAARELDPLPAMPTVANTAVVVVTYHPDAGFEGRFAAMASLAHAAVIVDNASPEADRRRLRELATGRTRLIENEENGGIGRALNQGVEAALAMGCEWILTFDQDTVPDACLLAGLSETWLAHPQRQRVALVGASYPGSVAATAGGPFRSPPVVITSGCLMPAPVYRELGPFAEELFMDFVDVEYALRARAAGYHVVQSVAPLMDHRIGHGKARAVLGIRTVTTEHGPSRQFTAMRNAMIVARRYGATDPAVVAWLLYRRFKSIVLMVVLEPGRFAKLSATLRGFWHGMTADAAAITRTRAST